MNKDTEVGESKSLVEKLKFWKQRKKHKITEDPLAKIPLYPGSGSFALLSDEDKGKLRDLLKVPKS